ncbi:MAG: phage portal protein [Alphaproteobacteria bacterium]|nr:phage portal protein [Alphaproteobacteria bacterium]
MPRASATPPELKASAAGPLLALQTAGRPVWTPRDYEALAREGVMKNPIAYRCTRMIAEAAASVPWLVYEGARELDDHPILGLLAEPNPLQSGAGLMERWYGYLQASGNAYLEAVSIDGAPRELYALRPDRMTIVPGPDGWPEAYEYGLAGRVARYERDETGGMPILHMALFHPVNDHYGLSPLETAATAIDVHNASAAWTKSLLDNAARPSGALVYKGPDGASQLSETQFARLKDELQENYQGARNAGRPLLLEGGLDWKAMSLSPADMDFIDTKHAAAREIALAFGVPPQLLGIPGDSTYSNYREANLAFWRQTVIPLVLKTAQALTQWLGPRYGGSVRLGIDLDQVDALSIEREALWQRVSAADFLSDNEKRAAVGYGAREDGER